MSNCLITGYWGEPHVTAENDRGINAAIFGAGRFVLPVGERFRAEYIGGELIRLYDGKLLDNGAAAGIPAGEHIDLPISFASSGKKRNDLIVFQYKQDISTLVETGSFMVLQGVETVETPVDPVVVQSDLLSNKATLDQMPLWRITVTDTAVSDPVQLFTLAKNMMEVEEIARSNPGGGSGTLPDEVLPIEKGGTGAKTAADALVNLGAAPAKHEHSAESITGLADMVAGWPKMATGTYAGNGEYIKEIEFDFMPKLVIITRDEDANSGAVVYVGGANYAHSISGANIPVEWDDNVMAIGENGRAYYSQFNSEYCRRYCYFAIG
jgi:hypothetical protein